MALIGYARVSTGEQDLAPQVAVLREAGCSRVFEEHVSGAARDRRALAEAIAALHANDVLVVLRIDRLARSLAHLLDVIETIGRKGAFFRSLRDPIDTTSPQGKFTLQILGATAEFERALIRERTIAGLARPKAEGRCGNPGLKSGDPNARRALAEAARARTLRALIDREREWLETVKALRPHTAWEDIASTINARLPRDRQRWTGPKLARAARTYVTEGFLEKDILNRSTPGPSTPSDLIALVAHIVNAEPGMRLVDLCESLERHRVPTARGARRWSTSSASLLLREAKRRGLVAGTAPGS